MSDTKVIQWHPGFVAAVNLELAENRNDLIYEKEYNLNTKPLEIDLLVIKKEPHVQISNEIGRLFQRHNIMEYKSPDDHLDVDAFYKTGAYASLYKAYGETLDERKVEDITVSIVREAKPEKLFQWLREHDCTIENPYHGIYYILGGGLFSTQIIVTRELDKENHTWLKALSSKIQRPDMENLLETINNLTHRYDKELADSVLEVTAKANGEMIEELIGDGIMCNALMEIMAPQIEERVEEISKERVRKASIKSGIELLRENGINDSKIKETIMKKFHLSEEEIEAFL